MRLNTLLVEQRNIKGKIVRGQKVRGFHPRAIDWVEPARKDGREYLLGSGIRSGLLFPGRTASPGRSTTTKTGPGASGTRHARAPKDDYQSTRPSPVNVGSSRPHHGDDLLDPRWIRWVAPSAVLR